MDAEQGPVLAAGVDHPLVEVLVEMEGRAEGEGGLSLREDDAVTVGATVEASPRITAATRSVIESADPMWTTLARQDCSMIVRRMA